MAVKICIVEDEHSIATMYEFKLQQSGYDVYIAADGVTGLALIEKVRPELILLDLMLPEMHGADLLEKLRTTGWGSKIRVIVLTNISKDEAPQKLRLLNVDRYIVKAHYTPKQVVDMIQEVLG